MGSVVELSPRNGNRQLAKRDANCASRNRLVELPLRDPLMHASSAKHMHSAAEPPVNNNNSWHGNSPLSPHMYVKKGCGLGRSRAIKGDAVSSL